MTYEIVAIITPNSGKEDRVREGLEEIAKKVHERETNCLRYQVYERKGESGVQFVVFEEYKDKADFDAHANTEDFKVLGATIQQENLLAKPLDIQPVTKVTGFLSR